MYREFLEQVSDFIFAEDELEQADVIFVPGNGYPQMAERAAQLYREGYAPYVLPSGKFSIVTGKFSGPLAKEELYSGEFSTEWEFLRSVLIRNGVPETAILREDHATFTYENAIYSRQVTDRAGISVNRAILCCKTYHARRCLMYYRLLYPETKFCVCPVCADSVTRENWHETEAGVEAVTGEVTRIIQQFSLMLGQK